MLLPPAPVLRPPEGGEEGEALAARLLEAAGFCGAGFGFRVQGAGGFCGSGFRVEGVGCRRLL